ncbi:hypothetical protein Aazo_4425 ['Nostoc azollae' 0708]|jgi:hypothetical protein|uniref:Uncharacterized protein n=1 Tax=Nostoc azollae (strain 0708) TaxID=551115 RepID=D7DWS0_NOSA0|nr:hypothetical protein Aazo_4425 ['Nostoc azollae' 0708]
MKAMTWQNVLSFALFTKSLGERISIIVGMLVFDCEKEYVLQTLTIQ